MSANFSIPSQPPLVWNEKTVLEKGTAFLVQKKEELKIYQDLWNTSKSIDFYSSTSKLDADKVKVVAEKSGKEIEALSKAVEQLLSVEYAKNPSSNQVKQLSKIALVSRQSLNYFQSVLNDAKYPTLLNRISEFALSLIGEFAICATLLRGAALFLDYTPPFFALISWKVSLIFLGFMVLQHLAKSAHEEKVKEMSSLLEKAIQGAV